MEVKAEDGVQDAMDVDAKDANSKPNKDGKTGGVAPPRRMSLNRLRQLLDAAPFPRPSEEEEIHAGPAAGEDLESRVMAAGDAQPESQEVHSPSPRRWRGARIEVTSARRLKEAVAAAHAWSERVRRALPGPAH